jgi:hypothetical protein
MADEERSDHDATDEPSLELPSLRTTFRRRRRRAARGEAGSAVGHTAPEPTEQTAVLTAVTADPAPPDAPPVPAAPKRRARRTRLHVRLRVPGPVAALLTGAVVGLVLVGLTSAGLHLCTAWRGTSSCGNPGILLLLAINAVAVLLGALLLRLLGVDNPGSTSFLGVGLLVVLVLLALLPVVERWWMVIVVPALATLTYAAAWWLTTTYVEPGERPR